MTTRRIAPLRGTASVGVVTLIAVLIVGLATPGLFAPTGPMSERSLLGPAVTCPRAGIQSNVTRGPAPLAVAFCAVANGSAATYLWDFGDNGSATGAMVNHTFVNPGAYDVRVVVTLTATNSTTFFYEWIYATGSSPGTIGVNLTAPSTAFSPATVEFTAVLTGCAGYCWINYTVSNQSSPGSPTPLNNGGTVYVLNASLPTPGNWTISVVAGDPLNGSGNASVAVAVSAPTTPQITAVGATPPSGPAPLTTILFVNVVGGVTPYSASWQFGDGGNGTGLSVTHTYAVAGTYRAVVDVTDARGNFTMGAVDVAVGNATSNSSGVAMSLYATPSTGPAPLNVTVRGNVSGGAGPYTLSINFHNGSSPIIIPDLFLSQFVASAVYSTPGNYTIVAELSNSSGNVTVATAAVDVTSSGPPPALVAKVQVASTLGPGPVAVGVVLTLVGGVAPYTIQYVWGDGTVSSAANGGIAVHLYSSVGTYSPYANVTDSTGAGLRVSIGTFNVTASNGTSPGSTKGSLVPPGGGGWATVGLYAGIGIAAGLLCGVGVAISSRRRTVRREGEGLARALEREAAGPSDGGGAGLPSEVKRG